MNLVFIPSLGYNSEASQGYQLVHSFDTMLESGPLMRPGGSSQEEESEEGEGGSSPPEEDLHALLVKAWETKVFPVIQRRFRNDQERRSGLEQIKGALQLGKLHPSLPLFTPTTPSPLILCHLLFLISPSQVWRA